MLHFINQAFAAGETKLQFIGQGTAATVLTDGTDIYKFWLQDSGYDAFLEYVEKNQGNPYLPKLKSKQKTMPTFHRRKEETPDRIRWIKMEKLEPNNGEIMMRFDGIRVKIVACALYFIRIGDLINTDRHIKREVEQLLTKPESGTDMPRAMFTGEGMPNKDLMLFIRTACDIGKIIKRLHLTNDLSFFNFMKRGDTPVIIDPIASRDDHKFNDYLNKLDKTVDSLISGPSRKTLS